MKQMTIAYANHRPETIRLSEKIMATHRAIILEEPFDDNLVAMLNSEISIEDYQLGQEIEYPEFSTEQCRLLRKLYRSGITIIQSEPYYEHLFSVQNFFADGYTPDDLDQSTERYQVYAHEKEATGRLIDYYQAVQRGDFEDIIESVQRFAAADGARFRLRDRLRADAITSLVGEHASVCVEAGPMHLLLYRYLRDSVPGAWSIRPIFVEHGVLKKSGSRAGLFGPGDLLTAHYLLGTALPAQHLSLLAARALIFMKIIEKDEMNDWEKDFPHLNNETMANRLVNGLSYEHCKSLFEKTAGLSGKNAFDLVHRAVTFT